MNSWKDIQYTQKIGRLTNFSFKEKNVHGHIIMNCTCECGNNHEIRFTELSKSIKYNLPISCGCLRKENSTKLGSLNKKYNINEESIRDCPEMSYIIGLLSADGYISKYSVTLCLQKRDISILEKIKEYLGYTGSIKIYNNNCKLVISNKNLLYFLKSRGLCKNKTVNYKIPEYLKNDPDFWRGFFDGDGCVFLYNYKVDGKWKYYHYGLSLVGLYNVIDDFKKFCNTIVPITNKISDIKGNFVKTISITGKKSLKILNTIYKNSIFAIDRKIDKFNQISKIHE